MIYEQTEDAAGVEIIRENEENLKVFLAEKDSGNGVKQGGENDSIRWQKENDRCCNNGTNITYNTVYSFSKGRTI